MIFYYSRYKNIPVVMLFTEAPGKIIYFQKDWGKSQMETSMRRRRINYKSLVSYTHKHIYYSKYKKKLNESIKNWYEIYEP